MDTEKLHENKWLPVTIAVGIAVVAAGYYIFSGQGSLDLGTRELIIDKEIENVDLSNRQRIKIKCRNGESYEIVFTQSESNFDELIFNSCGDGGGEVEDGTEYKN